MSLMRSTVLLCACAFDGDRVDPSPRDRCVLIDAIASDDRSAAMYPANLTIKGNIVHKEEIIKRDEYKRWKAMKPSRYRSKHLTWAH